jgi:hypothetical protein
MNQDKLIYMPIQEADEEVIEQIRKWRNSKDISRYMYTNHFISEEEHENWQTNIKLRKDSKFWIIYYQDNPIGVVNLSDIDYNNRITDWGFYIGDEKYRGIGLSKLVLYHLMDFVFEKMGFHKMHTTVLENNPIAISLYEKMGFKQEGILKKHLLRDERYIDVYMMSILDEDWNNIKNNFKNNPKFYEARLE